MESLKRKRVHSRLYYPIGNTPPYNVTLGCRVARQCDILLLGCGDIRNILYTAYELEQNLPVYPADQVLNFHLNDNECAVLTRDLILFHIAKTISPDDEDDMKFLWGVWYDVLLSKNHSDRLKMVMKKLTKQMSGDLDMYFGNEDTEQSVKTCLESWSNDQTGPEELIKERSQFLMTLYEEGAQDPTKRVASKVIHIYHPRSEERLKDRYTQEVQEYTDLGTTRINTAYMSQKKILATFCVNPTFLPSDCKKWITPDDSSPFLSYNFELDLERYDGAKLTMANICLEKLKEWTKCFQRTEKRCKLQIYLWQDDAKNLCEKTLSEDQTYDFIDTSNLADDMGIIPLIVCCQRKLKEDNGVLRTESFDWHQCLSHGEHFLRLCVDISPLMYPTVLGLHLAEELRLGHEEPCKIGVFEGVNKLVFRWKKATTFTPCVLTGSDSLSLCLESIQSAEDSKSTDLFQKVTPALCDDKTKRKLVVRLTDEVSRPSHEQVNQVVELNDRYEIKVETPATGNPGDLTMKHIDCNKKGVAFQLATDKYQRGIALDGLKLFENKPAAFVTVYNHDEVIQLMREGKLTPVDSNRLVEHSEVYEEVYEKFLQGFDILKSILQINSHRLSQDSVDSRWVMRSFVRARYLFKTLTSHIGETGALEKYTEAGKWKHPLAKQQFVEDLRNDEGYNFFTSPTGQKLFKETIRKFKPICDCCGKMTDCKECSACNNAKYCSRSCQRKAWPQHKLQCNK